MAGCYGSHPEDRARERELDRYLDSKDQKEAMFEQKVKDLLSEDGECYPWTHDNVMEALSESDSLALSTAIIVSHDLPKNEFSQFAVADAARTIVMDYWQKMAEHIAERDL